MKTSKQKKLALSPAQQPKMVSDYILVLFHLSVFLKGKFFYNCMTCTIPAPDCQHFQSYEKTTMISLTNTFFKCIQPQMKKFCSKPKHIIKFEPCQHGINHPEAKGDFLKCNCRKLQAVIQNKAATKYYRSLP